MKLIICTDKKTGEVLRVYDMQMYIDQYCKTEAEIDDRIKSLNNFGLQSWEKIEITDEKILKIISFLYVKYNSESIKDIIEELKKYKNELNNVSATLDDMNSELSELENIAKNIKITEVKL